MPFTSASLMVSNFALCGMLFLAGFYSRDFILEMFSMRYVNIFGFFLLPCHCVVCIDSTTYSTRSPFLTLLSRSAQSCR